MLNNLVLQERDTALLREVAEVALVDSGTVHDRHFPGDKSGQACWRRLRSLAAHEILRPLPPLVTYADGRKGRLPTLYTLAPRGAELVRDRFGEVPCRVAGSDLHPLSLFHRWGFARHIHLPVNDACARRGLPTPAWILEHDTRPGVRTNAPFTERFVLYERFTAADGTQVSCRPDGACWLQLTDPPARPAPEHLLLYWEYDRSTQTLQRIARRVPTYERLVSTATYQKHFPAALRPTVRVFVVVKTEERLQFIAKAIRTLAGSNLVRLTTVAELTPEGFFGPIWRTAAGDRLPILRSAAGTPDFPTSAIAGHAVAPPRAGPGHFPA